MLNDNNHKDSHNSMCKLAPSPLAKRAPTFIDDLSPTSSSLSENSMAIGHKPSRLDLIDNTTLTSFPLAHPRPANINPNYLRNVSRIEVASTPHQGSSMALDQPDHQSPLVLIEDYIEEPLSESEVARVSQEHIQLKKANNMKRISLMNLKKKFHKTSTMNINVNAVDITLPQANVLDRLSVFSEELSSVRSIISGKAKRSSEIAKALPPPLSLLDETSGTGTGTGSASSFIDIRKQMLDLSASPILLQRQSSKWSKNSSVFTNQYDDELYVKSLIETEHSSIRDERISTTGSTNNTALSSTVSAPLKFCVLCEKPLYDISSLIPEDKKCEEIVCSDCFEPYNKIISIIRNQDTTNTTNEELQELIQTVCDNKSLLTSTNNNQDYSDYDYTDTTIDDFEEASNTLATILIRSTRSMEFSNSKSTSPTTKVDPTPLDGSDYVFNQLIKTLKLIQARDSQANQIRQKRLHTKQSIFDISNLFNDHMVGNTSYGNITDGGRERQDEPLGKLDRLLRTLRLK